jgi:hypothetical protein
LSGACEKERKEDREGVPEEEEEKLVKMMGKKGQAPLSTTGGSERVGGKEKQGWELKKTRKVDLVKMLNRRQPPTSKKTMGVGLVVQ